MGQDTAKSDGGANQGVELFVAADGELQMAWGDALNLEILGGVLWKVVVALVVRLAVVGSNDACVV